MSNERFFDFVNNTLSVTVDYISLKKYDSRLKREITTKNREVVYLNRPILFIEAHAGGLVGYGECAALEFPYYTSEYCDEAAFVLENFILKALKSKLGSRIQLGELSQFLGGIQGHNMAKSALEMAIIDLTLKSQNIALGSLLNSETDVIRFGGVVDGTNDIEETIAEVKNMVEAGYSRIKVKINPGVDPGYIKDIRNNFSELEMFVDANETFESFKSALEYFKEIEDCNLTMIEQPFHRDEILANTRLGGLVVPPICLDEPIVSSAAGKNLIETGACDIPCVKVGRMGGLIEVLRFHEILEESGVYGYIGGNFSSDLGKWVDLLLSSLSQFSMIPDISMKDRGPDVDLCPEIEIEKIGENERGFKISTETFGLGREFDINNIENRLHYHYKCVL